MDGSKATSDASIRNWISWQQGPLFCCFNPNHDNQTVRSTQATMAEQLDFDPAMFGMKSNHGMLRSTAPSQNNASGANAVSVSNGPSFNAGRSNDSAGQGHFEQGHTNNRGNRRGGAGFARGRGGNRGSRGGRGGNFNNGQRSNNDNGHQFKVNQLCQHMISIHSYNVIELTASGLLVETCQQRQRFDNETTNNRNGSRGFFKPSMLEDPWKHLS